MEEVKHLLNEVGDHDDGAALFLPDHAPKVANGAFQWSLGADVDFGRAVKAAHVVGVDVASAHVVVENRQFDMGVGVRDHIQMAVELFGAHLGFEERKKVEGDDEVEKDPW